MKLILWPDAKPINFHLVAYGREFISSDVKDTTVRLIQSQNGNLFTLDRFHKLRIVAGTTLSWLDALENGERLRFLRNTFGISQKELADMYHVHQTAIANWENGYKELPVKRIQQIKETLWTAYVQTLTAGLQVEKED